MTRYLWTISVQVWGKAELWLLLSLVFPPNTEGGDPQALLCALCFLTVTLPGRRPFLPEAAVANDHKLWLKAVEIDPLTRWHPEVQNQGVSRTGPF